MNTQPLVSVIIPAYRCADCLARAIDSALRQDVPLEVLVLNDGSPEDLDSLMAAYRENPAVRYLKNPQNLGVAETRNRGVRLARGQYIAFLDADDYWLEGKLKKQLAALQASGCVLCATARELMTPEGRLTGRVLPMPEQVTYRQLLRYNCISCSSVLLRADVAREFPMHHPDSHEDYILWMEILKKYGTACGVNEPLLKYRLSSTGKSGSKLHSARMTYTAYRYAGLGRAQSALCFCSYALNGVWKYTVSRLHRK